MLETDINCANSISLKPFAFDGMSYPYFGVSPNEFEELLYQISIQEIEYGKGELNQNFDSADWLDKPGDRGRDILLYKNQKSKGVIQCKHTKNNTYKFSKDECVKEIIKFILHYSIDSSLIDDIDTFTYYFAVSSGFKEDSIIFLENIEKYVSHEQQIDKWINSVRKEFKKIDAKFIGKTEDIKDILSKLKVKRIDSTKIDLWLNHNYNQNILRKHFNVKIINEQKEYTLVSDIPIDEIQRNIKASSHFLFDYNNFFYGFPDSHIERKETTQLLNWIKEPLNEKEDPLAILVGTPGIGKSVVLKDLLEKLEEEKISYIGIKADQYYTDDKESLEKRLGLCDSFEKITKSIIENHGNIVVIIDQLDALSLSLSGKREHLLTYQTLIHQLLTIPEIRIVTSIRKFDLETDSDFTFLKKYKKFLLSKLSKDEINTVLKKLKPQPNINDLLYGLLGSPYNLNAFVKIYSSTLNLNILRGTVDLYKELWSQKVVIQNKSNNVTSNGLKKLLYSLALRMHEKQMITVPLESFSDDYSREIEYLGKEGILSCSNSSIQFFHQTFYDFVFAKQFCESGASILKYTLNRWQSLGIRSMVKMVFGFLRETKPGDYIKMLSSFLFSKGIRFHFQLLLIQILTSEQNPTEDELDFVKRKIFKSRKYRDLFIESIQSNKWLQFIISEGIIADLENVPQGRLDKALVIAANKKYDLIFRKIGYVPYTLQKERNHYLWRSLLLKMLPEGRDIILDYITKNAFKDKSEFIRRILYFLKIWDNALAFKLYEEYLLVFDENGFDSYKIMEDALFYDIDWVLMLLKKSLAERISLLKNDILRVVFKFNHSDTDLFDKLYKQNLVKTYKLNLEVVILLIEKSKYNVPYYPQQLILDHAFHDSKFDEKDDYRYLFYRLGKELQKFGKESSPIFNEFIINNISSNYESIVRLVIFGLIANPEKYIDTIYTLFVDFHKRNLLNNDNSWHYYLRKLLGESYPFFSQRQKNQINTILLTIRYSKEYYLRDNSESGKKIIVSFYNHLLFKYLLSISENEIKCQKELYKKYQECQRRYKDVHDDEPHYLSAYTVGPPLNAKAYEHMSLKQWKESFQKYINEEQLDISSSKGGITEHARAFEAEVKKRPDFFADFIYEIICVNDIDITYIIHGLRGLVELKYNFDKVKTIVQKTIEYKEVTDHNITEIIWIIDYFIENEYMDNEIFEFIVHAALYGKYPDQINNPTDLIFDGINSTRGSAIERLIQITYKPEYADRIFETVIKVSEDQMDSVKATVLFRLAYLNHYDLHRSFDVFKKLVDTSNEQLLKTSLWSAGYYKRNFYKEMIPYFRRLMNYESLHEDTAVLLAVAWLEDIKESKVLLEELLLMSDKARIKMIHVAETNLFHENNSIQKKCLQLFNRFLNNETKAMADEYSHLFLRLSPDKFEMFLPSIKHYSKSTVCKNNPYYFFEYLFKCTGKHPVQCIDLLENVNILKINADDENRYRNDEALNVIVGSYNALLKEKHKNKRQIIHSVKLFDQYLKDRRYRKEADKVLDRNDRE
jgi:hypothetical protein